jgi:hypothetical protein
MNQTIDNVEVPQDVFDAMCKVRHWLGNAGLRTHSVSIFHHGARIIGPCQGRKPRAARKRKAGKA